MSYWSQQQARDSILSRLDRIERLLKHKRTSDELLGNNEEIGNTEDSDVREERKRQAKNNRERDDWVSNVYI